MKKYVSPKTEFIEMKDDIFTDSPGPCDLNVVCNSDETCLGYVCPNMYGSACAGNPYN